MSNKKPVMWINVFTAKPGKLDELIAIQPKELHHFKTKHISGWLHSHFYRSEKDNKAIMMTAYDSVEAYQNFLYKNDFTEHLNKVEHLVENAVGGYYTLVEHIKND
jgi:hypothetical protein